MVGRNPTELVTLLSAQGDKRSLNVKLFQQMLIFRSLADKEKLGLGSRLFMSEKNGK